MRRGLTLVVLGVLVVAFEGGIARSAEPKVTREVWEGTLKVTPQVQLRLVLNLRKGEGGALTATLDSPDQGATGLNVDAVAIADGKLTFAMKGLSAAFEGTLDKSGNEATGEWSQGGAKFPLALKRRVLPAAEPIAEGKEVVWEGKLSVGGGLQLRLVFHVNKDDAGVSVATMDSPDQGANGIKVDVVKIDKDSLFFEIKSLNGRFEGKMDPAGDEAIGEWTQGPAKIPLRLRRAAKATEARRPQTPKAPFPYQSEEVKYENKAGGVTLAGTLTIPEGSGPYPAVILISGSGAQDRDETLFEHKPFFVLADHLTRRGVAVLRVDDRGVGGSTGDGKATTADFAGDVLAGVDYLKSRKEINARRIGLIGHSEGGIIAPMAATTSPEIAFIVLMAGTGLPGDQIVRLQSRLIGKALGVSGEGLEQAMELQDALVEIAKSEADPEAAKTKMNEALKAAKEKMTPEQREVLEKQEGLLGARISALRSPWFRYFLNFDPRPTLGKVRCPVLAIVGEKDLQVPPKENLSEIKTALEAGGNTSWTVKELPGLNHLFQTARTGSTTEYATIEETIAPEALRLIGDWVVEQGAKR